MKEQVWLEEPQAAGFWNSAFGRVLRWVAYIPAGLAMAMLTQIVCVVFLYWLFRDMRGLVIIGVLFGGLSFVFVAGYIYYGVFRLTAWICPSPKPGMVIFGVIFILQQLGAQISNFRNETTLPSLRLWGLAISAVCSAIGLSSIVGTWKENK